MTESPRRNIFEMYLSRFTGCCLPKTSFEIGVPITIKLNFFFGYHFSYLSILAVCYYHLCYIAFVEYSMFFILLKIWIPITIKLNNEKFTFSALWSFDPHLLDILKNHVAMTIEGLNTPLDIHKPGVENMNRLFSRHVHIDIPAFGLTLTRAINFRLFLQLMRTWVLLRTDSVKTESGPVWNSCFSRSSSSSGVKSAFGLFTREAIS